MFYLVVFNVVCCFVDLIVLVDGGVFDVIVIGGGIIGVGIVLDVVICGLMVVLVEKYDLVFGISCWSLKLVYGGLCYLVSGNVGIVWCSVVECGILMICNVFYFVYVML